MTVIKPLPEILGKILVHKDSIVDFSMEETNNKDNYRTTESEFKKSDLGKYFANLSETEQSQVFKALNFDNSQSFFDNLANLDTDDDFCVEKGKRKMSHCNDNMGITLEDEIALGSKLNYALNKAVNAEKQAYYNEQVNCLAEGYEKAYLEIGHIDKEISNFNKEIVRENANIQKQSKLANYNLKTHGEGQNGWYEHNIKLKEQSEATIQKLKGKITELKARKAKINQSIEAGAPSTYTTALTTEPETRKPAKQAKNMPKNPTMEDFNNLESRVDRLEGVTMPKIRQGDYRGKPLEKHAKLMQEFLKFQGYYTGDIDSIIGNGTIKALRKYQKENNLQVDGIAGRQTWTTMADQAPWL